MCNANITKSLYYYIMNLRAYFNEFSLHLYDNIAMADPKEGSNGSTVKSSLLVEIGVPLFLNTVCSDENKKPYNFLILPRIYV